jgi:predicted oxidoreductase
MGYFQLNSRRIFMNLTLSPIVWGAWRVMQAKLSAQELNRLIQHCLALGITSFDHADLYGSFTAEAAFGEALALSPGLREKMQLLTKCGIAPVSPNRPSHRVATYNSGAVHIAHSIDASLAALRTDRLDLLMIHRPDFLMDARETADALAAAVQSGKVRAVGVSNFSVSQVALLKTYLSVPITVNQIELSLSDHRPLHDGVLDQCQQLGITPMAWSPLAGGALFGDAEIAKRLAPVFARIALAHNVSEDAIALAWLMKLPSGVVPVIGTAKLERITSAWQATRVTLARDEWYELYVAAMGARLP